ncbi:MAG: GTPase ObgE [Acholeplasmataceae bacterium]|nr:MAG: GTPase ObgE [Acholeplasmataceae bacterium]
MFVDEIKIDVQGGKGGNGMASFRREKYVEFGGPSGGNGGHGGAVIFVGDEGRSTLFDLRYRRHIKAKPGVNGMSKGMHGKNAPQEYVRVPLGTIVHTEGKQSVIGEVTRHGEELVVAKGGKGGRGNIAFATAKNPAPNIAEKGDPGESRTIVVELKVLADVGIIGYPSVGKSTLVSVVSNARPKIADYPFTTLQPNLGMVEIGDDAFVMADLPGLIENAHQGHGLGIRFLRHIERCRVFLHMLDLSREDPYQDYLDINHELEMYDEALLERPQVVVANKIDLPGVDQTLETLRRQLGDTTLHVISAAQKKDVMPLMRTLLEALQKAPKIEPPAPDEAIYRFEDEGPAFTVEIKDGIYELSGEKLRLLFERTDFTKDEAVKRFARQLRGLGVDEALRAKGARHGDVIRIFEYEFEFIE